MDAVSEETQAVVLSKYFLYIRTGMEKTVLPGERKQREIIEKNYGSGEAEV